MKTGNRYFVRNELLMSTAQAHKLELLEWLVALKDEHTLAELIEWKEDHQRVSIERYNQELEEADAAIDRGEFYTQEEVESRSKSW